MNLSQVKQGVVITVTSSLILGTFSAIYKAHQYFSDKDTRISALETKLDTMVTKTNSVNSLALEVSNMSLLLPEKIKALEKGQDRQEHVIEKLRSYHGG